MGCAGGPGRCLMTAEQSKPLPFEVTRADDILIAQYPEPKYAVPDLLSNGLGAMGGRPKVGKSRMGLQLAQAKGTGGYVLGRKVELGPVLYLALEDSPRRLQKRMREQNWSKGALVDFVHLGTKASKELLPLHEGGVEKLQRAIEIRGYAIVIIDTFKRAIRGLDTKKPGAFEKVLEPLQEIAQCSDCLIWYIDHIRKIGEHDGDIIEDLIDSTSKSAPLDTAWGLYRERGKVGAKLQITGRDIEERTLSLKFDSVTMTWQVVGEGDKVPTPKQKKLIETVRKLGGRCKAGAVAGELGDNLSNISKQLKDIANDGFLEYEEDTKEFFTAIIPSTSGLSFLYDESPVTQGNR